MKSSFRPNWMKRRFTCHIYNQNKTQLGDLRSPEGTGREQKQTTLLLRNNYGPSGLIRFRDKNPTRDATTYSLVPSD